MNQRACLITPTYAKDLEGFRLLRRSIDRCGIDIPHLAVIHDEDLPLFRDQDLGDGLELISTRDVLPREIEKRRQACGFRRRDPRRWIAGKPLHGWIAQQFIKLSVPAITSAETLVFLDSDTLFLDHVDARDFMDPLSGKPHLYESFDDVDAEMAEWVGRSMRFLGVNPTHQPVSRFTHAPAVMCRSVLLDMQRFIENRHKRKWIDAMERFGSIMEYSTYGVFAKYVDNAARVVSTRPNLCMYYWWSEDVARLVDTLPGRLEMSGARILLIQSNGGLKPRSYQPLLEQIWADRRAVPAL